MSSVVLLLLLNTYKKKNEIVKYSETKFSNGIFINDVNIAVY